MKRNTFIQFSVLLIVAFAVRQIVLGGSPLIRLSTAPPLSGAISQSLATPNSKNQLSVEGKDYNIKTAKYFDEQAWAVVSLAPLSSSNASWLVLQNKDGIFQVVLGPGTAFDKTLAQSLPSDVITYLQNSGVVIYNSIGDSNE